MMIFGHVGLTTKLISKMDPKIDFRPVILLSLLPDLIDKPLAYFIAPQFTHGFTRTVGHSLICLSLLSIALFIIFRKVRGIHWMLFCIFFHLICDFMWRTEVRISLFWPFLGHDFPDLRGESLQEHLIRNYSQMLVFLGDIFGLYFLIRFFQKNKLYQKRSFLKFLNSGRLS